MKLKVNPTTAWAIAHRETLFSWTVRRTRRNCIDEFCGEEDRRTDWVYWKWFNLQKKGFRCIKVNIVPVDE